jgi:hypothetical protein
LFVLGGPFIWLIDEYTYHAKADLRISLYDMGGVNADLVGLGDPRSLILVAEAEFLGIETDFVDRVAWEPETQLSSYLASVFTSTFLVGQESSGIATMVSQGALTALGSQVAETLLERRDEVLAAASMAQLANIVVDSLDVTYDGKSFVGIAASLILRPGSATGRLTSCRIEIGGRTEEWSLEESVIVGNGAKAGRRYHLSVLIPDIDPDVSSFRMILTGGKGGIPVRTYTFSIPRGES